jgi:DNA-binding transcriptional LysR family regulator
MMNITLHQLKVFEKVAELASVTQAAQVLHMTQPAVSNILRKINKQVGAPVFDILHKKVNLSPAGHILLDTSMSIHRLLEESQRQISATREALSGSLAIATVSTAKYFIVRLIAEFKKAHPELTIRLIVKNRETILERLRQNLDDLVVMSQIPNDLSLAITPLFHDQLVVAAHPRRAEALATCQSLSELANEPWIIREAGSGTRMAMLHALKRQQVNARIVMEIDNNESIKQALQNDLGISMLSRQSIELELSNGCLSIIDLKDFPLAHAWYAVTHRGKKLAPLAASFLNKAAKP